MSTITQQAPPLYKTQQCESVFDELQGISTGTPSLESPGTVNRGDTQQLDKSQHNYFPPPPIPSNDLILARVFFVISGAANALNFSAILQSFKTISENVYEFKLGPDSVSIIYHLFSVLAAIVIICFRTVGIQFYYSGLVVLTIASICFPLCIQFLTGTFGLIAIHLVCCFMGCAMSLVTSNTFSFSTALSTNFTGFVVAGNSLSGIISMLVWLTLTNTFFNIDELSDVKLATWSLYTVVIALLGVQAVVFLILSNREWFRVSTNGFFQIMRDPLLGGTNNNEEPTHLPQHLRCRPIIVLGKIALEPLLLSCIALFIGYSLFPNIGPNQFVKTRHHPGIASILTGMYQVSDFIGRYTPNIGPSCVLKHRVLQIVVYCRLLFIPVFFSFFFFDGNPFFENFFIQSTVIVFSALIHGFTSSQTLMDVPKILKNSTERGAIGLFSNLSMQTGVLLGLIFAIVFKLSVDPDYLQS